jgi:hypothetical protein
MIIGLARRYTNWEASPGESRKPSLRTAEVGRSKSVVVGVLTLSRFSPHTVRKLESLLLAVIASGFVQRVLVAVIASGCLNRVLVAGTASGFLHRVLVAVIASGSLNRVLVAGTASGFSHRAQPSVPRPSAAGPPPPLSAGKPAGPPPPLSAGKPAGPPNGGLSEVFPSDPAILSWRAYWREKGGFAHFVSSSGAPRVPGRPTRM